MGAILGIVGKKALEYGGDIAQQAIQPVLGMAFNSVFHNQQLRHQQDFINQQMQAQQQMGIFNQKQALEMWKNTNYGAQMKELEKAGLNPGLMYGHAGQGGQTTGGQAGSVTGATAPNATATMGLALQQQSQIKLLDAQANNLNAQTRKLEAEVPKIGAEVANIGADTTYKEGLMNLLQFNTKIAQIESEIAESGKSLKIGTMNAEYENLISRTKLTDAQKSEIDARVKNLAVQNALMASEINVNSTEMEVNRARVKEIINGIEQRWNNLEYNGVKIGIEEMQYGTGQLEKAGLNKESAQELLNLIVGIVGVTGMMKGKPGATPGGLKVSNSTNPYYKY